MKRRRAVLVLACGVTLMLTAHAYWQGREDEAVVEAALPHGKATTAVQAVQVAHVAGVQPVPSGPQPWPDLEHDPFGVASTAPPPPPPPPVVAAPPPPPPPKPTAPPLPYRYFGRMADPSGKIVSYLVRGDALIAVQEQDVLDQTYRIDKVDEQHIVLTYLPLDERAVISLQAAAD